MECPAFYRPGHAAVAQHIQSRDTCSLVVMMSRIIDIENAYVDNPKPKLDLYLNAA